MHKGGPVTRPKLSGLFAEVFGSVKLAPHGQWDRLDGALHVAQGSRTWGTPPDDTGWTSIPLTEIQDRGWPTRPVSPEMPRRSKGK